MLLSSALVNTYSTVTLYRSRGMADQSLHGEMVNKIMQSKFYLDPLVWLWTKYGRNPGP